MQFCLVGLQYNIFYFVFRLIKKFGTGWMDKTRSSQLLGIGLLVFVNIVTFIILSKKTILGLGRSIRNNQSLYTLIHFPVKVSIFLFCSIYSLISNSKGLSSLLMQNPVCSLCFCSITHADIHSPKRKRRKRKMKRFFAEI